MSNFIPNNLKVAIYKHDSTRKFLSYKRQNGAHLFASDFVHFTGYNPVDKPRDYSIAFEREATGKFNIIENTPVTGFKIVSYKTFKKCSCVWLKDPRGWYVPIRVSDFISILNQGININNGITDGQLVYSVVDDYMYNLLIINSPDYNAAIKEDDEKARIKSLRSNKISLEVGKVYNFEEKNKKFRVLYLGCIPGTLGDKSMKWHALKKFSEDKLSAPKYTFLKIEDKLVSTSTYIRWRLGRFSLKTNLTIGLHVDNTNKLVIRRDQNINMNASLGNPENIDLMYLDDYSLNNHNWEFKAASVITMTTPDWLKIRGLSDNQSWIPNPNYHRNKFKHNGYSIPSDWISWTLEELIVAIQAMSKDWFLANEFYVSSH